MELAAKQAQETIPPISSGAGDDVETGDELARQGRWVYYVDGKEAPPPPHDDD
jgi:hypothetical protein